MSEETGIKRKLTPSELKRLSFEHYTLEVDSKKRECRIKAQSGTMEKGSVVFLKSIVLHVNDWSKAERVSTGSFSGCLVLAWPKIFAPLYRRKIEALKRAGRSGNIDISNGSTNVHLVDFGGYNLVGFGGCHDVKFDAASLNVEAFVCDPPGKDDLVLSDHLFIRRREFSDYGVRFIESFGAYQFLLSEDNSQCIIKSRRGDFGDPDRASFTNLEIEIKNWSRVERKAWRVMENVDITKFEFKSEDIRRVNKFRIIEEGCISLDVELKDCTLTHIFHDAEWKTTIDCRSDMDFDYIDDWTGHSLNLFKSGKNSLNTPSLDDL